MRSPLKKLLAPLEWLATRLGPSPQVTRPPDEQARVDRECEGLALYHFRGSPESIQVRREIIRLGLTIEVRDAQLDYDHRQTLEKQGGRLEAPCLRIARPGGDEWLYGPEAIKAYLHRHFSA